jgi:hypothetical protein
LSSAIHGRATRNGQQHEHTESLKTGVAGTDAEQEHDHGEHDVEVKHPSQTPPSLPGFGRAAVRQRNGRILGGERLLHHPQSTALALGQRDRTWPRHVHHRRLPRHRLPVPPSPVRSAKLPANGSPDRPSRVSSSRPLGESVGEDDPAGGLDEGKVGEGLWEVAEVAGAVDLELLGVEAEG